MTASSPLPRLAVVYGPRAFSPLQLFGAAAELCRLVWVIEAGDEALAGLLRQLRRLGDVVDTTGSSIDGVAEHLRQLAPSGILAFDDDHLSLAAQLGGRLGLPSQGPATVAALTDKYLQRQRLAEGGVPGPRYHLIEDVSDPAACRHAAARVRFPAVLKPAHGSASRHTYRIAERSELAERTTGEEGSFVLEEYLPDPMTGSTGEFADFVSVETVIGVEQVVHMAITGKLPLVEDFREGGHFVPALLDEGDRAAVLHVVDAALSALGVTAGATHTEVKLTPDGPRVVEVNGRVGGAVPDVLSLAGGPDLIRAAMSAALGNRPDERDARRSYGRVGYQINVQPPKGAHRVVAIEGIEAVGELPGVLQVENRRPPGAEVDWREGTEELVLRVLGAADDLEGLRRTRRRLADLVVIDYE